MDNSLEGSSPFNRRLFFSAEPIVVTDLPLVVGGRGERRELAVEISNAGSIAVIARSVCDNQLVWNVSLPRERGLFCVAVDGDVSIVGMAVQDFFSVQVLSLRGVLFLELSRDVDGTWTGSTMSREFFG